MKLKPSAYDARQGSLFDDLGEFAPLADAAREMARKARIENAGAALGSGSGRMLYMSLGSGSSGNCSYLGDDEGGFLIDCGIDGTTVAKTLLHNGIDMGHVKGIILTHDHHDHIKGVYSLLRANRHLRLYCTPRCMTGLLRRHSVSRRIKDYHVAIYKEFEFKIGNFTLTAFDVSHDGTDNMGYFITRGTQAFAIATDLGAVTDRVDYYLRRANHIVIESNYDYEMLRAGRYPEYLKARIMAANGHLDNAVTADFISRIYTPRLRHVFLCHLSLDNNTPQKALDTMRSALLVKAGIERVGDCTDSIECRDLPLQLMALPRFDATPLFVLREPPQS